MYAHEHEAVKRIGRMLRTGLPDRVLAVYTFGSKARMDHSEWSDFDILVIVKNKTPEIENKIMGIIVDEEMKIGLSFAPIFKDETAFTLEKKI